MSVATKRKQAKRKGGAQNSTIFGVPARFMRPRLLFIAATFALFAFGLIMVFSASSIVALSSTALDNNPAYYLQRQAAFGVMGIVFMLIVRYWDYHSFMREGWLRIIIYATIALLLVIMLPFAGHDAFGASRWIQIGPFTLQPSEFAKLTVIVVSAKLAPRLFSPENTRSAWALLRERDNLFLFIFGLVCPLILIVVQPDNGTTFICLLTMLVICCFAGFNSLYSLITGIVGTFALLGLSYLKGGYTRLRIQVMFNPEADPKGAGYQLLQGFYAFSNGGFFGRGLGNSIQKYNYLPMAYNDFIFAVIGEELGLAGIICMFCLFGLFIWAAFEIGQYANDMEGQLICVGVASLVAFQLLLNTMGVTGLFPLSGKPIPFISYGGSSIISSFGLVGLVLNVSRSSRLPDTISEQRRQAFTRLSPQIDEDTGVSEARPRSLRPSTEPRFSRGTTRTTERRTAAPRLRLDPSSGRRRIDLGPSAADRLRGHDSRDRR